MSTISILELWLAEEAAIVQKTGSDQGVFLFEWLQRLEEYLKSSQVTREEQKKCQKKISDILLKQIKCSCTPATRQQLSKCIASFYSSNTTGLFDAVEKCKDIIKNKDDSQQYLPIKLAAICCLGSIYQKAGRMVGTLFIDTEQSLMKFFKTAESEAKCEVLLCFENMLVGLDNAASPGFKDIYKASRNSLTDKSAAVRCSAAKCALELTKHASFLYTTELDNMASCCFKALEGSNYDVRVCVAELLGTLMAFSQSETAAKVKKISLEEVFSMMTGGFLRGSVGFLKGGGGELLKGGMTQEVRVGVTQAYVVLFRELGTAWVEKYLSSVIIHVLELVANPKAIQSHIEAVYSRKCVSFILHSVLFAMIPEQYQIQAMKELCKIITKQMNVIHNIVTSETTIDNSTNIDVINTQHVLVCALHEIASLSLNLSSSVESLLSERVTNTILSVLIHPAPAAWLSAAWCMRCCALAIPRLLTTFIDTCVKKMSSLKSSTDALTGYGHTLAAMVGGLHQSPLGIPFKKAKALFNMADEMLQMSTQSGKLVQSRVQTGWALIGSLISLGPTFIKGCIQRLFQLLLASFPQSAKEIEAEKNKGNAATFQLTLENRTGALSAIFAFLKHCKPLLTSEVTRKIIFCVDTALAILPGLQMALKSYGSQLKPTVAMLKLRLYRALYALPPKALEGSFSAILRELVAEFTLADHKGATTTSLLQSMCHKDDSILLGTWLQETDHTKVEEQLQTNSASGSGALEHDPLSVFAQCKTDEDLPGPLPLGVAVIDSSIELFGAIFPHVVLKHRAQLMDHFNECISKNKGPRQQAIQVNIFTAFLAALKGIAEIKGTFGDESLRNSANTLVQDALMNSEPTLRCAGGEALGRMVQVVNDQSFVAQMALLSFEKAKAARDGVSRSGHSLALGCLHRYVGGMGSGQHLNNSVAILLALAKEESSFLVQVWALHGLTLIADSGGPMFRQCVEPTMTLVLELLLKTPPSMTEVHQCLGKCMGALITSIGPELQDTSKNMQRLRLFCTTACSIMQNHPDSLVQSEAIYCLQQLHIFAPNFLNLNTVVPQLCATLFSRHLLLRRASVACLRHLAQREAQGVWEHSLLEIKRWTGIKKKLFVGEESLAGVLFTLFDSEVDTRLKADIKETLVSLLQSLASESLVHWLSMCKQVLLASKAEAGKNETKKDDRERNDDQEDEDEDKGLNLNAKPQEKQTVTPKWPTRVFAIECIRMIIDSCKQKPCHVDLALAREMEMKSNKRGEFLVMHLSELVRMAFIAGTSNNDQLKLEGMKTLLDVVQLFSKSRDPDIPGHVILEQFLAQVGTALRPAFTPSTPPDIIAMACEVCSEWIGSGISRDINDVRRIQQMLTSSLRKLSSGTTPANPIYSESAYTLETLAVLKAWAKIYIMAVKHEDEAFQSKEEVEEDAQSSGRLLDLVEEDLRSLAKFWMGVLRDYAFLMLPKQYHSQLPKQGGIFYSPETVHEVRAHYRNSWPPIAYAFTLWLTNHGFVTPSETILQAADENLPQSDNTDVLSMTNESRDPQDINKDRYHLLNGICMEALCSPFVNYSSEDFNCCLCSIDSLLATTFGRAQLTQDKALSMELLVVLNRLLLTRDSKQDELTILSITQKVSQASVEKIAQNETEESYKEIEISQGKSVAFSLLEIAMLVVSKYAPEMIPAAKKNSKMFSGKRRDQYSQSETAELLSMVAVFLSDIQSICTAESSLECLPSTLYLLTGILKFSCQPQNANASTADRQKNDVAYQKILHSLKLTIDSKHLDDKDVSQHWLKIAQSACMSVMELFDKAMDSDKCFEKSKVLYAVSIFILSGHKEITSPPVIQQKLVQLFANTIEQSDMQLKLQAVRIIESIIKTCDISISSAFIHGCIPSTMAQIESPQMIKSDSDLTFCKEVISLLELLLAITSQNLQINMMCILIPFLIQMLPDESASSSTSKYTRLICEHSLERIKKIGPMYPHPFKAVMEKSPSLKSKLEASLKSNQRSMKQQDATSAANTQPKIQLKMNFSNFK
eukprot:gene20258-22242_t